ncbi:hypothetical protein DUI87_27493 [Hirundo rustica rustica]|uniref:Uncharacterized protein n=1 Tax=Hirundo rustica rustica TaxID=333673 RepID=A0A3M0JAZ0_HIRRU|nr:hypothetical protein DUI87_27493 [Hirundo rustica rustica]
MSKRSSPRLFCSTTSESEEIDLSREEMDFSILKQFWGLVHGIWPQLKRDQRRDGRSLFGPPGQLAKREQPGTSNEEERRRVSIPAAGKGDVRMGV